MNTTTPAPTDARSSDDLRARLSALYTESKTTLAAFAQYAESAKALSVEFLKATLQERFPDAPKHEGLLIITLDAAESPKLSEKKISELQRWLSEKGSAIRHIEHDLNTGKFYVYA